MGYYLRVFSQSSDVVPLATISQGLSSGSLAVAGDPGENDWRLLRILRDDGLWMAELSRDLIEPGSVAFDEIGEFEAFLEDAEPVSGATWTLTYLKRVKTIYAFEINTTNIDATGWRIVDDVRNAIHNHVGGILQADREGFSNEDGYHITWDFSDSVSGDWWMAVRAGDTWTTFRMKLENHDHRAAFRAGRVPDGVTPARAE